MNVSELLTLGDFVPVEELHHDCAVYALCLRGRVVYIGQSQQVRRRLQVHKRDRVIPFDQVLVCFCAGPKLIATEVALIARVKPPGNRSSAYQPPVVEPFTLNIAGVDFVLRPKSRLSRAERIAVAQKERRRA